MSRAIPGRAFFHPSFHLWPEFGRQIHVPETGGYGETPQIGEEQTTRPRPLPRWVGFSGFVDDISCAGLGLEFGSKGAKFRSETGVEL